MYDRFKELGVPVVITRDSDKTLTRNERLNIMRNSFGTTSDVLILSNHINAGNGEGAEVVYPLRTSEELPLLILEEIRKENQIIRKAYQRVLPEDPNKDYYYIMRETPNTTALLIEYGFIDNKNDLYKLNNYLLDYVEAVVRAVCKYYNIPYNKDLEYEDTYIVQRGDTLYSISKKFGISVDELKRINNLDSNFLSIGQVLMIKLNNIHDSNLYTVVKGDNLYSISKKFNISVEDLINSNNLESTILYPGQVLVIPVDSITEIDYIIHKVKYGDTLYSIAREYNVSVDDIISLNKLTSTNIYVGENLQIPNIKNNNNNFVYRVERGDTLYSISRKFNVDIDYLKKINNLNADFLRIDQELLIPIK